MHNDKEASGLSASGGGNARISGFSPENLIYVIDRFQAILTCHWPGETMWDRVRSTVVATGIRVRSGEGFSDRGTLF